MKLDKERGFEVKFCPQCSYAIERCDLTRYFIYCPLCQRNNIETRLVDRFVVHVPENKVLAPTGKGTENSRGDS